VQAVARRLTALSALPENFSDQPLPDKVESNLTARSYSTQILSNPQIVPAPVTDPYPFFEMAVWVDREGAQHRKWTVRRTPTPFIAVRDRPYFRDAMSRRHSLYEHVLGQSQAWVQPIVSWNSGESSVMVALPHTNGIAAIESKLLSVIRPVLPPGLGFCIITPEGQVLLHADATRNLQENLLEECDGHPLLRSALLGGQSEPFTLSYQGRAHAFYVTPMPGCGWSLAVFRDAALLNDADFDLLVVALFLFGLYFGDADDPLPAVRIDFIPRRSLAVAG
jgi:hypothetical protein